MSSLNIRANRLTNYQNSPPPSPPPRPSIIRAPRPVPAHVPDRGHRYDIVQKIYCLVLITEKFSSREIEAKTGVKQQIQSNIKRKAFQRGYRPDIDPRILSYYVEDAPRSGRIPQISTETEEALLREVKADRAGREKSSEVLAYSQNISVSSALRILKKHGLTCVKPTRKPGLNVQQKKARLKFCVEH
jgi:hypothetical protein